MRRFVAVLIAFVVTPTLAAPEITWDPIDYDPGPIIDSSVPGADLIIPLPCGGAIALMRVETEALADEPLNDQRFRMGAPDVARAPYEFTRTAYIRGPFADEATNRTYYFMGRYEVTRSQYDAVTSWAEDRPCSEPDPDTGALPITEISWFDAQLFTARLSEWARGQVPELMPRSDGKIGFFRLPSEEEWEFAVRGGLKADSAEFNALRFTMDGKLKDYAWHEGRTSSQGELQFVGTLRPSPLGLYDVYGNAEEMVFDLFSLNNLGRRHGQYGGFMTRGGSFKNKPSEIGSSTRHEYSFYDVQNPGPSTFDKVGLRVVLANFVLSSDRVAFAVVESWERELDSDDKDDPLALLTTMIDQETELPKRSGLEAVQSALVNSLREAEEATALALRRAIFSGAAILRAIESIRPRRDVLVKAVADKESEIDYYLGEIGKIEGTPGMDEVVATYQEQVEYFRERLEKDRSRLADYNRDLEIDGTNYVATVDAVYESSKPESLRRAADLLAKEMDRSEQTEMEEAIATFTRLVESYRENPAMTREEMLAFQ